MSIQIYTHMHIYIRMQANVANVKHGIWVKGVQKFFMLFFKL